MENDEKSKKEIYIKMAAVCSRSEKCSFDILQKIRALGLSENAANEIVEKLKAESFIDDKRYACSYVSDKFKFNNWGVLKIRYHLKMKKLSDEIIQKGLDRIDKSMYRKVLLKMMKEKARTVKKKNKYEKMGQIIRYAQNKGFEPELIHRYLNEIVE